jgi:predicted outer membrane repeat protein
VYVSGTIVITNSQFLSNTAQDNGGGASAGSLWASGGLFNRNRAGLNGSGVAALSVTVSGTQFINNNASVAGSISAKFVDVTNAQFSQNFAVTGAGVDATQATVRGTQFLDNQASDAGGGIAAHSTSLASIAITDSVFLDNFAPRGGAVWSSAVHTNTNSRIVNSLFAHNFAFGNTSGAAELQLENPGTLLILHTTFADKTHNSNPVIAVLTGTVGMTNNIIVSHSVGISQTAGFVYEDFNLFFGNSTNAIGTLTSGGHDLFVDPLFVAAANDNYHLSPISPAIDAGGKSGVTTDFDGETRPRGAAFDIGFDEVDVRKIYLPALLR